MLKQKRAMVTPTDDILRPKRLYCIVLIILYCLSTQHNAQRAFREKKTPLAGAGAGHIFLLAGRGMFGMLEKGMEVSMPSRDQN